MHRDTKLGLALGMLVIGFAAAFCFPRPHQQSDPGKRTSIDLAEHEPEIELIPVRAYRQPLPSSPPLRSILNEQPSPPEQTVVPAAQVFPGRIAPEREPALSGLPEARTEIGETESKREVRPEDSLVPSASPPARPAVTETYTVQSGDTLSGIALRFLGSSTRFQEIFEANRDTLASPDSLKLGMVLTIPQSATEQGQREADLGEPTTSPSLSASDGRLTPSPTAHADEKPAGRFQNVGNAPFVTSPARRVSQQGPEQRAQ